VLPAASSDRRLEEPALRVVLGLLLVYLVAGCFGGDPQKTVALAPPHQLHRSPLKRRLRLLPQRHLL